MERPPALAATVDSAEAAAVVAAALSAPSRAAAAGLADGGLVAVVVAARRVELQLLAAMVGPAVVVAEVVRTPVLTPPVPLVATDW